MTGTSSITRVLSMRISNDIYDEIQAMALREEREISDFVRILLREALDAREKRAKRKVI